MAEVRVFTAARMLAIEAASVISGLVSSGGDLILTRHDGSQINAGSVLGPQGLPGVNAVENDAAVAGYISTSGTSAVKTALLARIASEVPKIPALIQRQTRPVLKSEVTKGLYDRTQPLPGGSSFRALAKDPYENGVNGTGRVWGVHSAFAQIGYTDDDGATWQVKSAPFVAGMSVQSMKFTANYVWITTANVATSKSGQVWRMARPTANGNPAGAGTNAVANLWGSSVAAGSNGAALPQATINISNGNYFPNSGTVTVMSSAGPQVITYTGKTLGTLTGCTGGTGTLSTGGVVTNAFRIFNLNGGANGPGGAAADGGVNSTFRNSCFDVNDAETYAAVIEYGGADAAYQFPAWTDVAMAPGSSLVYTSTGRAAIQMTGLSVTVAGAGPGGSDLVATVLEVVHPGNNAVHACLRLAAPARTWVSAATLTFPSTTYGSGNIPGGPSVYHSANPAGAPESVTFSKVKQFPLGKHGHSIRCIGNLWWAGIGDLAAGYKENGIHISTSLSAPSTWVHRSLAPTGTIPKDPINMLPVITEDGRTIVACESDSSFRDGPLTYSDATGTGNRVLEATCTLPQPYTQTMRQLTYDPSTKNLYWYGTSEGNALGPTSCVWMARAPWTVPILLEDLGSALELETAGDGVLSNGYFWIGTYRMRAEKFIDQT